MDEATLCVPQVYIVTELVSGGELLDRVTANGNYTEADAAKLIKQMLDGVSYLHSKGAPLSAAPIVGHVAPRLRCRHCVKLLCS